MADARELTPESRAVLAGLAAGRALGEVAASLHLSRRTADRRLAQARQALGVATTAQAIAALSSGRADGHVPATSVPLVGRDGELSHALAALGADEPLLVVGEGGVGKTAFVAAAVAAEARPSYVATGQGTAPWKEYGPLALALGTEVSGDVESAATQVEAVVGPGVLVVDDVHLADSSTLAVLRALAGRVAVLAAARPDAPGSDLGSVGLLAAAGYDLLVLDPLDLSDAAALARSIDPTLRPDRVREIVDGSGGLPLIVEVLCGSGPDTPTDRGLVPSVHALSAAAMSGAVLLAVSSAPLHVDVGGAELVDAGIAVRTADGRLRIRHQLIADAVLSASREEAVADAHRCLAGASEDPADAARHWAGAGERDRALEIATSAADGAGSPAERARLLQLAAGCCSDERAPGRWLDAAGALAAAGLFDDALEAAARIDERVLLPEQVGQLCFVRARSAWHRGDAAAAVAHAHAGLEVLSGSGSREEAALLEESVRCEVLSTGTSPEHDERLERAAAIIGTGPGRASLLNVAALLPYFRAGEGLAEWEAGLEAARVEGDVDTAMRCANNVIMWNEASGDPSVSLDLAMSMAAEAASLGLGSWQLQFTANAANLLYHRGRYDEAMSLIDEVEHGVLDERTRQQVRVVRAAILIDLGLLDAAREHFEPSGTRPHDWLADDGRHYLAAAWELAAGRPRQALLLVAEFESEPRTESAMWTFLLPVRAWAEHDLGLPVTRHELTSAIPLITGLLLEVSGVAHLAEDPRRASELLGEAADLGARWSLAQGLRARWGAAEAARLAGADDAVERLLEVEQAASDLRLEPLLARIHRSLRLAGVTRRARRAPDGSGLLTARERALVDLVAAGASYDEIARRLGVGRPTVRRILRNARLKLGAESRLGAVAAVQGA